jgi:hypothetical protein
VILPEDMKQIAPRFAAAGLTAKLIETDEPDVEDDQIEIFRDGIDTRVTIQISLTGSGYYYVNEYRGEGASLVMRAHGEFCSLRKAIDCAITVVQTKQRTEAAS